ncbi:hypothetical protein [Niallia endozanthoxylica]|uniref:Uncharacterized protein n=1 Tax=Niallia endozanthoxylica TaxID=2036016 RepID=A0A5J5HC91_9BACI|nr:hypothetical protein [Niallia endozanthoxylica]KAA9018335.1 hypothetical protein F4V44_20200 [Niallia endozanthoxylica]
MTKENEFPNIPSPFSAELDAVMRDDQKFESSHSQARDESSKDLNRLVSMDAGVPTDSLVLDEPKNG